MDVMESLEIWWELNTPLEDIGGVAVLRQPQTARDSRKIVCRRHATCCFLTLSYRWTLFLWD